MNELDIVPMLKKSKIYDAVIKILEIRLDRQRKFGDSIFDSDEKYFQFFITEKYNRAFNTTDIEAKKDSLLDLALYALIYYTSLMQRGDKK